MPIFFVEFCATFTKHITCLFENFKPFITVSHVHIFPKARLNLCFVKQSRHSFVTNIFQIKLRIFPSGINSYKT
ncbi:hypothetical protein BH11BAC3_BH11BAC3_44500 [soil metagenome]